jgi:hypothetical protein
MRIYRVENSSRIGPYQLDSPAWEWYDPIQHPRPSKDGLPGARRLRYWRYAFASYEQLSAWFSFGQMCRLAARGWYIEVIEVPDEWVLAGRHQVAYLPESFRNRLDLIDLSVRSTRRVTKRGHGLAAAGLMKQCTGCGAEKPPDEFYRKPNGLLMSRCKDCMKSAAAQRYALRRSLVEFVAQFKVKHPDVPVDAIEEHLSRLGAIVNTTQPRRGEGKPSRAGEE